MKGNRGLLFCLVVCAPWFAGAQVVITEVMYDLPTGSDTGREWIEIYNSGSTAVDITALKLFENGTNHKITAVAGEMLAPGAYAVIASNADTFKSEQQYSGALFDSVFSLGNSGETIGIKNASSTDLDVVSYQSSQGGAGDGNTLNRENSTLVPRAPSPGAAMAKTSIEKPKKVETVAPKPKTAPKAAPLKQTESIVDMDASTAIEEETPVQQTAAAFSADRSGTFVWWSGAAALALAGGAAAFAARRVQRKEWQIEEVGE